MINKDDESVGCQLALLLPPLLVVLMLVMLMMLIMLMILMLMMVMIQMLEPSPLSVPLLVKQSNHSSLNRYKGMSYIVY